MLFIKFKMWRADRRWKKYGRREYFTWLHRYFRLHRELLEDPVYKDMYEYYRATLIAYRKRDGKKCSIDESLLGESIDVYADVLNFECAEGVNAYKNTIERTHSLWKNDTNMIKEIRI